VTRTFADWIDRVAGQYIHEPPSDSAAFDVAVCRP